MKKVTPQPIFGRDVPDSVLRLCREYSEALNQLADHRFSEFVQVSGNYTAGENDHVIECSPSGAMTVTLPAASVMRNKRVVVKRANNTTHTITIQSTSGTIDDAASVTLTTAYQSREVFSDGSEWWLLDVDSGASTDPYWDDVILLIQGGADNSLTLQDLSQYGDTATIANYADFDTTHQVFGHNTVKQVSVQPEVGGFSSTGANERFSRDTGSKFTIECWVYIETMLNFAPSQHFFSLWSGGNPLYQVGGYATDKLRLRNGIDAEQISVTLSSGLHFIQMNIDGDAYTLDLDGVEAYSGTNTYGYGPPGSNTFTFYAGGYPSGSSTGPTTKTWATPIRVTRNVLRARGSVPTAEFPTS